MTDSPSVSPSVRMEHLGSHGTDFHEIWYFIIIEKKSVQEIQAFFLNLTRTTGTLLKIWQEQRVLYLKSDNNNGYST